MILFYDCMNIYMESMGNAVKRLEYFSEKDLGEVHLRAIDESMAKVCWTNFDFNQLNRFHVHKISVFPFFLQYLEKPRLGGAEIAFSFRKKFEYGADEKFHIFKTENEERRQSFIVSSTPIGITFLDGSERYFQKNIFFIQSRVIVFFCRNKPIHKSNIIFFTFLDFFTFFFIFSEFCFKFRTQPRIFSIKLK